MPQKRPSYATSSGPLRPFERAAIERLAEAGHKPGAIAFKLRRHPSTVRGRMNELGLLPAQCRPRKPSLRQGRPVNPFCAEEDALIERLRRDRLNHRQIGEAACAAFGHARTSNTIRARLLQLAARANLDQDG